MEIEVGPAQTIARNTDWMYIINHVDKNKKTKESTSEAVCNGIWNEILRRHFPYPRFIIAPEQRQTTGGRPDFTIFTLERDTTGALSEWQPIFTFEGKAPRHQADMLKKGKDQAIGYLSELAWPKEFPNQRFGMLACGASFVVITVNPVKKTVHQVDLANQKLINITGTCSLSNSVHAAGFDKFCADLAACFH